MMEPLKIDKSSGYTCKDCAITYDTAHFFVEHLHNGACEDAAPTGFDAEGKPGPSLQDAAALLRRWFMETYGRDRKTVKLRKETMKWLESHNLQDGIIRESP